MTNPPLSQFNLPQVLEFVSPLGCRREHLIDYLKSGALKAVCFPYCQEPDHAVAIKPDQWKRKYRDGWSFREHDGWIGNEDIEKSGTQFPLTIVPDEVDELLKEKTPDDKPIVSAATAYVLADEFKRFFDWMERHAEQGKPLEPKDEPTGLPPSDDAEPSGLRPTLLRREQGKKKTKEKYSRWYDEAQKVKDDERYEHPLKPSEIAGYIATRCNDGKAGNIKRRLNEHHPGWADYKRTGRK